MNILYASATGNNLNIGDTANLFSTVQKALITASSFGDAFLLVQVNLMLRKQVLLDSLTRG
jgi:hypothetical protein